MRRWWTPRTNRRPADCRQVARLVQHHIDGELDEPAARAVAQHLKLGLHCGLDALTYRELKRYLSRLHHPVGDALVERLGRIATWVAPACLPPCDTSGAISGGHGL